MENYVSAQSLGPKNVLSLLQEFCHETVLKTLPPSGGRCWCDKVLNTLLNELTKTKFWHGSSYLSGLLRTLLEVGEY